MSLWFCVTLTVHLCCAAGDWLEREVTGFGLSFRYFVLDFEAGLLQYFVNEQSKHQKPRGVLSLSGAIVSLSDEAPHMLVVYSANGEMYKLRGTFLFWDVVRAWRQLSVLCWWTAPLFLWGNTFRAGEMAHWIQAPAAKLTA